MEEDVERDSGWWSRTFGDDQVVHPVTRKELWDQNKALRDEISTLRKEVHSNQRWAHYGRRLAETSSANSTTAFGLVSATAAYLGLKDADYTGFWLWLWTAAAYVGMVYLINEGRPKPPKD